MTPQQIEPQLKSKAKNKLLLIPIILLVSIAPAIAIYIWQNNKVKDLQSSQNSADQSANPQKESESSTAPNKPPAGYKFYEDKQRGFKFAYPEAWGEVVISPDTAGGSGEYLYGTFSSNRNIHFGGRGENYRTAGRGGMPTDQAAFKKINSKAFWISPTTSNDSNEDQGYVKPVEDGYSFSKTFNSEALLTKTAYSEFTGFAYDSVSFNLGEDKNVYAISLIIKNPNADTRAQVESITKSFELL